MHAYSFHIKIIYHRFLGLQFEFDFIGLGLEWEFRLINISSMSWQTAKKLVSPGSADAGHRGGLRCLPPLYPGSLLQPHLLSNHQRELSLQLKQDGVL